MMKLEKFIPRSSVAQKIKNSIKSGTWKFKTKPLVSLTLVQIFLLNMQVPSVNLHLIPPIAVHSISQINKSTQARNKNELCFLKYKAVT